MNESSSNLPVHAWWQTQFHETLQIDLGPCAWHAAMLRDQDDAALATRLAYLKKHPSLLVVPADADDALCAAIKLLGGQLPLALCMAEPSFVRRFEQQVIAQLASLGVDRVSMLVLEVDDLSELKSGGLLQVLFDLRERELFDHVGLAVEDALGAEWLATRSAARVMMLPYGLDDQSAAWRALQLLEEEERFCIAREPTPVLDAVAAGFALAQSHRVLGLFDEPLPAAVTPMSHEEAHRLEQAYQQANEPPAKLPRSHAPD